MLYFSFCSRVRSGRSAPPRRTKVCGRSSGSRAPRLPRLTASRSTGLARSRTAVGRSAPGLHRLVRVRRRADPHESPLRRGLPRPALDSREEPHRERRPRGPARGRNPLRDADRRRARRDRGHHGAVAEAARGLDDAPPTSGAADAHEARATLREGRAAAMPDRDAVRRRPVLALQVQALHRRAAGVRARRPASRRSAATPTISSSRAGASTWRCCAPTRTASRRTPNHFAINFAGPAAGEPVFVSGHPGSTDRQLTLAQLKTRRNLELPQWLLRYSEIRGRYIQFAETSPGERAHLRRPAERPREQHQGAPQDARRAARRRRMLARKARRRGRAAREASRRTPKLKPRSAIRGPTSKRRWRASAGSSCRYAYLEDGAGFQGRLVPLRARAGARRRRARQTERGAATANTPTPRCRASSSNSAPPCPIYPELEELAPRQRPRAHARVARPGSSDGAQAACEGIAATRSRPRS